MDQAGRFQRNQELRRDGAVTTSLGVDVVTGLAVLVYDFPGAPLLKQGFQEVEGVPTVLASWKDGDTGTLVSAYPSDATLVAPGEAVVDDQFVLQALTILRDAARRGLVHGDLGAGRFLWAGRRLYLEGYGVPWRQGTPAPPERGPVVAQGALEAALRNDLRAGVKALLELGSHGFSTEVAAALKAAASGASASDATGLQAVVRRLAGGAVKVPSAGFVDIVLPTSSGGGAAPKALDLDALEFTPVPKAPVAGFDFDPHDIAGALGAAPSVSATRTDMRVDLGELPQAPPPPARPPAAPRTPAPAEAAADPDPITLQSDPGPGILTTGKGAAKAPSAGFVKHLPPGATYRAGSLDDALRPAPIHLGDERTQEARRKAWRGPALLLLLLLVVALGSYLALRAQRNSGLGQVGAGAVRHLVDVRVSPSNLPPVSLVVDRSPDGSSFSPGTIIGSVPRRVSFDANGTWVVHAQFQGRSSASVTLRVPDENVITLVFPDQTDAP